MKPLTTLTVVLQIFLLFHHVTHTRCTTCACTNKTECLNPGQYMFPYGPENGDSELPHQINAHYALTLPKPISFFGQINSYIEVDSHGVLWPGWYGGNVFDDPTAFPVLQGYQVVACYWADSDLSRNPSSHVYYRVATDYPTILAANGILQQGYGPAVTFDTTSDQLVVVVVTWLNLTYSGGNATTPTNSFQCAMLSDGTNSFVLYSYQQLQWLNSPVEVQGNNPAIAGVDDGRGSSPYNNFTLPTSHTNSVTNLASVTNFYQVGISGWNMLSAAPSYPYQVYNLSGVSYKTCQAVSDPHYFTFDGLNVDAYYDPPSPGSTVTQMQKTGYYIMAATSDCHPLYGYLPFAVLMKVDQCYPPDPSATPITCPNGAKILLFYSNYPGGGFPNAEIDLYYDKFQIGGFPFPPQSYSCGIDKCPPSYLYTITPVTGGYTLTTDFGLSVQYVGQNAGSITITLPTHSGLTENIFGYCGNLDGLAQNDNYCWNAADENYQQYQNCWQASYLNTSTTNFGQGIYTCQNYPALNIDEQKRRPILTHKEYDVSQFPNWALQQCQVFIDPAGVFSACQSIATSYYTTCLLDVTATNNDYWTFCLDAEQFAQACLALPCVTTLSWRNQSFCPLQCPSNAHYSSSHSSCINTCNNPFASAFCTQPPMEGCICNDGYVAQGIECILPANCGGCLNDNGVLVATGTQWVTGDCSRTCVCNGNGNVVCTSTPCDTNAVCITKGFSPVCQCNAGYYGNGYYCNTVNNCSPINNCQNNATCVSQLNGYQCVCKAGYTSQYCDQMINYCTTNPCINGGLCNPVLNDYTCTCPLGYGGKNCDQQINWCASFPCVNSGTCVNQHQTYVCNCAPKFTGVNCETSSDETTVFPTTINQAQTSMIAFSTFSTTINQASTPTIAFSTFSTPSPPPRTTSQPSFNCSGLPDGDYQDPENPCSHTYYTCANGQAYKFTCPSGLDFNQQTDECMSPNDVPACRG